MGTDLQGRQLGRGISQRKDGSYYARLMISGKNIGLYDRDLDVLRLRLDEERQRLSEGQPTRDPLVSDWFNEWFTVYKQPFVKQQSVAPMRAKVENILLPYIKRKRLSKITGMDLQMAIDQVISDGKYSPRSIREAANRLDECFTVAMHEGMMRHNPAAVVVLPRDDREPQERRFFTNEEIRLFLEELQGGWWYEMAYVMIHSGMRIGEISGLRWQNVDWKNEAINIKHSLSTEYGKEGKREVLTTPKTRNSFRRIPFLADVKENLKSQKKKVEKLKKELGPRYRAKDDLADLVFVTTYGSPVTRYNAQKVIDKTIDSINRKEQEKAREEKREYAAMPPAYPHALRHTFASLCFQAGASPKVVQQWMGHANYATTIDIYTHIMGDEMMNESILKFNDAAAARERMNNIDEKIFE